MLENIKNYFQVGEVRKLGNDAFEYKVSSLRDLQIIVNHFKNYPLISQKWSDFKLFTQVIELMEKKEHLTQNGLEKIVSIKSVFNKGLPDYLKSIFPNILPIFRPLVPSQNIPDPYWISGFVSGEGLFLIEIKKYLNKRYSGFRFLVTQHIRDTELLKKFVDYLGCGYYSIRSSNPMAGDYHVSSYQDIIKKIIPFFDKHPIQGTKFLDFCDFKEGLFLKTPGKSLTENDLIYILELKSRMNKGRRPSTIISSEVDNGQVKSIKTTTRPQAAGNKRNYSTQPGSGINSVKNSINNS